MAQVVQLRHDFTFNLLGEAPSNIIKREAKVQAAESSPHCVAAACDAVTDVTGQTDAPHKLFYKLQQRHRDVSCHSLLCFPSEKKYTPNVVYLLSTVSSSYSTFC